MIGPSTSPSTTKASSPETSPFTTSDFPMMDVSWLSALYLRGASATDGGAVAAGIRLKPGSLGSLSDVGISSLLRDGFHMILVSAPRLIPKVANKIYLTGLHRGRRQAQFRATGSPRCPFPVQQCGAFKVT